MQYQLQIKWISELLSLSKSPKHLFPFNLNSTSNSFSLEPDLESSSLLNSSEHYVSLNLDSEISEKSIFNLKAAVQGPYLLQPAPIEVIEEEISDSASDLFCFGTDPIGVVIVAYESGKCDVLLEVERIEAKWDIETENDLVIIFLFFSIIILIHIFMITFISYITIEFCKKNIAAF